MKYIDADKLKKLIDEKWKELADKGVKDGGGKYEIEIYTYLSVLRLIDSFQQEQPEVDLEKEVEEFCLEYDSRKEVWFDMTPRDKKMLSTPTWSNFATNIARHFWNKGYNAGKKGLNYEQIH